MIPKNAITMRGKIDRCWLVALRADPEKVRAVLPQPLQPILHGGFAYLGIVASHLTSMRPAPLPGWMGMSYWHAAYRIYARLELPSEPPVEGLWFIRSDADSALMCAAGNLLTDFRFHNSAIRVAVEGDLTNLSVLPHSDAASLAITLGGVPVLSEGSPFGSLREAAKALEYAPAGLSVSREDALVMRIGRDVSSWRYRNIGIVSIDAPVLAPFEAVPEVAYEVEPIEYQWNRARRVRMLG